MTDIYENTIVSFADYADFLDFEASINDEACKCPQCNSKETELVLTSCGVMYDPQKGGIGRINIMQDSFIDGQSYLRCNNCETQGWVDGIVKLREVHNK